MGGNQGGFRGQHFIMGASGVSVDAGAETFYPDPDAAAAGGLFGASQTAGDSPFAAGDRDIVVYAFSYNCGPVDEPGVCSLEDHSGNVIDTIAVSTVAANDAQHVYPGGIRLSGARITMAMNANISGANCSMVWDFAD